MLVEFSVANYGSFSVRQSLSMVASRSAAAKPQKVIKTGNALAPNLLRTAVIFGPNGAGKTNLLSAMVFVSSFVANSSRDSTPNTKIPVSPFRLDRDYSQNPSEFEIIFVHNEALYQYGFSCDSEKIHSEWLYTRKNGASTRTRRVFERVRNGGEYDWYLNENYLGSQRDTWRLATRGNALFLSTANQLNSPELRGAYNWISNYFRVTTVDSMGDEYTSSLCMNDEYKNNVVNFLRNADIDIDDIVVEKVKKWDDEILRTFSDEFKKRISKEIDEEYVFMTKFIRILENGDRVIFDEEDESSGLKALYTIAGPWMDVKKKGYTLVMDELQSNLHPIALRYLVSLFDETDGFDKNSQLIFTTHDTSILLESFVHRDQVWLVDRPNKGASALYPLSDFDIRDGEALQRGYLSGRFGALPRVQGGALFERSAVQKAADKQP